MNLKTLLKDPFLHFIALGALIFLFVAVRGNGEGAVDRDIIVSAADVARLEALWQSQYSRPPSDDERAAIIDNHIREEVLFREAMSLDLGNDDIIVRRRLVQKFLFLSEDLIELATPGDGELDAWYEEHQARYLVSPQISFRHVYLSAEKRAGAARGDAAVMVARLQREAGGWRALGDPFMLQREYAARKETEIAELFGSGFAGHMATLEEGAWTGPVRSAYGWHAVQILKRAEQSLPALNDIRGEVLADYNAEKRDEANQAFYQAVRARYNVTLEAAVATKDNEFK